MSVFEKLWSSLATTFRNSKFKQSVGLDQTSHMVIYSLCDPTAPMQLHLSRWMLPIPAVPSTLPAERVEQALYNVSLDPELCSCTRSRRS